MTQFKSLLDEALEAWHWTRQSLIEEVQNIPAGKFGFRLAPGTRTVAEVVQHIFLARLWT